MPELTVVYWRDIPAQVIAKQGRKAAKRELSQRFQQAIDRAAMRSKSHTTDAYLADWRRGDPAPCDGDLDAAADACAAELESTYDEARLDTLVKNDGREG